MTGFLLVSNVAEEVSEFEKLTEIFQCRELWLIGQLYR